MKKVLTKIFKWNQWPLHVFYAPMAPFWLWCIIRSRAIWFFTPSNPKLTFGGMEGEPKKEMYDLLPPQFLPVTFNINPAESFEDAKDKLCNNNISYPLVVKPEIGGQGILFRKIDDEEQFKNYHKKVPVEYIVQQLVNYPMEVCVFYYRYPNSTKGVITGFLQKIPLQVTGNGKDTLYQLIVQHPKACERIEELRNTHGFNFDKILLPNENYILSYAANRHRGARLKSLKNEIDNRLVDLIDNISLSINDFFYGRYDIMCSSVEDLKQGKNFYILEYNGCGAGPTHIYGPGYTLVKAYRELAMHWEALYKISIYNRKHGVKCWP
ncbi:MAG: hypothetical protein H0W75_11110, partial [Chitinophagaceae bacterium]|nr:hypothetical protein [Chitinophagaceae bacterium]